jgi:NADH:ubiquinone oxidoreductase subunit 3 (subunit A)
VGSTWAIIWQALAGHAGQLESSAVAEHYLTFAGVALAFAGSGFGVAAYLRKRAGYTGGSKIAYEGGEEPIGSPWVAYQAHYFTYAIIFLLFEVEIAFMFPFALAEMRSLGSIAFLEGALFIAVLGLGLAFAWLGGLLDWPTSKTAALPWTSVVPQTAYASIYTPAKLVEKELPGTLAGQQP